MLTSSSPVPGKIGFISLSPRSFIAGRPALPCRHLIGVKLYPEMVEGDCLVSSASGTPITQIQVAPGLSGPPHLLNLWGWPDGAVRVASSTIAPSGRFLHVHVFKNPGAHSPPGRETPSGRSECNHRRIRGLPFFQHRARGDN